MSKVAGNDKIGWIHVQDRRLLVGRNDGADLFYLPGGSREAGETDVQTLVREAEEELSVELDPATARHFGTFVARRDRSLYDFVFITYFADRTGEPVASMEVVELRWVTSADGESVTDAERQLLDQLVREGPVD